ncbi:MAG: metallophosphoesterase [Polyangiaceae bacterium]
MARTVVVGDVHGCRRELEELLSKVGRTRDDRLCFVGDLLARGPDGLAVLELVEGLGADVVLGNHERRLLEVRQARMRGERPRRLGPSHARLFESMGEEHFRMLEAFPYWLDLPEHELRIVHAGVVPGVPIEEQDPWALTHMRTLTPDGRASDTRDGVLWGERYTERPHVVFGHNAVDGLQIHAHATGIDTGCVYGNTLTALVLPKGCRVPEPDDRRDALVDVQAHRAWAELRPGA